MSVRQAVNVSPRFAGPDFLSQAIVAGDHVYVSGQIGVDPESGALPPDCARQTELALDWIEGVLAGAGLTLDHVVKVTVFLRDLADYEAMNRVYQARFKAPYPARSCVAVRDLAENALVEIEAVAIR